MKGDRWTSIAAILAFTGVALGAFGAHGLKKIIAPDMLAVFETGVRYHLIHALAILALSLVSPKQKLLINSLTLMTIGVLVFSLTLYAYSITGIKFFAIVTPLGGVLLLVSWYLVARVFWKGGAPGSGAPY